MFPDTWGDKGTLSGWARAVTQRSSSSNLQPHRRKHCGDATSLTARVSRAGSGRSPSAQAEMRKQESLRGFDNGRDTLPHQRKTVSRGSETKGNSQKGAYKERDSTASFRVQPQNLLPLISKWNLSILIRQTHRAKHLGFFKGRPMPGHSSFWSANKTNRSHSQLLSHMLPMAFIPHRANSSLEQSAAAQTPVRWRVRPVVGSLLKSEQRHILPENDRHAARVSTNPAKIVKSGSRGRPWGALRAVTWPPSRASRCNTLRGTPFQITLSVYSFW